MKRFLAILLAVVLIAGMFPAYAAAEWKCEKCDAINDGNFCGECGSPKPVWKCSECSKENTTKYCSNCGVPKEYSDGSHALNDKEYEKAGGIFGSLDYGDSKVKQIMAIGQWGVQLWEQGQYDDAVEKAEYVFDLFMEAAAYDSTFLEENDILYFEMCIFSFYAYSSAGDEACEEGYLGYAIHMYEQAYSFLEQIPSEDLEEFGGRNELFYGYAEWLMQVQSYELAAKWFGKCGDYLDSVDKAERATQIPLEEAYQQATTYEKEHNYEAAIALYETLGNYKEAQNRIIHARDAWFDYLLQQGAYAEVNQLLESIGNTDADIHKKYYELAEAYLAAQKYDEASAAFVKSGTHNNAETRILEPYYVQGTTLLAQKDYDGAITAFTKAGSWGDAETMVQESNYQKACSYVASRDYYRAYEIFTAIKGYRDTETLLNENEYLIKAAELDALCSVGNYVTFGSYPQTKSGTDDTPIDWFVLSRQGSLAELVCWYTLEWKAFDTESTWASWKTCSLRTWLNEDFINGAFSPEEQELICHVIEYYPGWEKVHGTGTGQDKVSLLSGYDATMGRYSDVLKFCEVTEYAKSQGAYLDNAGKYTDFWLDDGQMVSYYGNAFDWNLTKESGVRPVIIINLAQDTLE